MKNKMTVNTTKLALLSLFSGLSAGGVHLYLFLHYYSLRFALSGEKSICNINAALDCDTATLSSFATFLSLPIALWGLWFNLALVLFLFIALLGLAENKEKLYRYNFWLCGFLFLTSVIMGAISIFYLGSICLFCFAAYFLSFLQLFFAWKMRLRPLKHLQSDFFSLFKEKKWLSLMLLAIIPIAYFSNSIFLDSIGLNQKQLNIMLVESLEAWKVAKKYDFNLSQGLIANQNPSEIKASEPNSTNGKISLVEFIDPLCSHCKHSYPTVHSFVKSHPRIHYVLKFYPLDGTCNKGISHKGDGLRCQLVSLVYCAEKLEQKGWEAQDWVFEHQSKLGGILFDASLVNAVKFLNLDLEKMKSCLLSNETFENIQNQAQEGTMAELKGTPAFFINGKNVERGQFQPIIENIYNEAIKTSAP